MQIHVDAKSQYGVKNARDGKWYNSDKSVSLDTFKVGGVYDVELKANKKNGKTYMNIVSAKLIDAPANVVTSVAVAEKPVEKVVVKPSVIAAPVAINKDERILVQGLTQALLQSPIMAMVEPAMFEKFVEAHVVTLVNIVKKLSK